MAGKKRKRVATTPEPPPPEPIAEKVTPEKPHPPVGALRRERNMDLLVESAKLAAIPHLDNLLEEIKHHVSTENLDDAQTALENMTWSGQQKYAETTHLHMKRADAYGHLVTRQRMDRVIDSDGFCMLTPREGLAYFEQLKIVPAAEWKVMEDSMRRRAFSVARMTNDFCIERTRDLIAEVLKGNLDERQFRKQMATMMGTSWRDYYIETVYRTNMQAAYNHGRWVQQTTPEMLELFPYWEYKTVGDSRVRDSHAAMNGKVWPADHPMWNVWYPLNGFACRCYVNELMRSDVKGRTVQTVMPEDQPDPKFASSPRDWIANS